MYIVHVFIHVKHDELDKFKTATIENARQSAEEPGVARFDFIQQADDTDRFVLVEVYRTAEDAAKHKETAHYNTWHEVAEPLMVEPRSRIVYQNVFPGDTFWK